jgi:predicted  nucleic acid-binding Zn ribbon protein
MVVLDLVFRPESPGDLDALAGKVMSFVADLKSSGQRCDPWPAFVLGEGFVTCRISVPALDSLDPRHDSKEVASGRTSLGSLEIRGVGEAFGSSEVCVCDPRPFLMLLTTFLSHETPLLCGGCGGLVPLYTLPTEKEDGDHTELLAWEAKYRYLDGLWMASEVGEGFAFAQLSRRDRPLMAEGLEICGRYERAAGVPVYAFFNRYYGDLPERCPDCGGDWTSKTSDGRGRLRCQPCRVVQPFPGDTRPAPEEKA